MGGTRLVHDFSLDLLHVMMSSRSCCCLATTLQTALQEDGRTALLQPSGEGGALEEPLDPAGLRLAFSGDQDHDGIVAVALVILLVVCPNLKPALWFVVGRRERNSTISRDDRVSIQTRRSPEQAVRFLLEGRGAPKIDTAVPQPGVRIFTHVSQAPKNSQASIGIRQGSSRCERERKQS